MDNQPQMVPVQPVSPPQPPVQQPVMAQQPVKKKSLLWLWITLPIVVILAVLTTLFFIFMYPDMQARSTATRFMNAVKTSDDSALKELSGDTSSNSLIKNAHEGLKSATFSVSDSKNKGSDGYVVNFKVEGSSTLKNTSVILKDNKVSTFLLNVGVASSNTDTSDDSTDTTNSLASTCLLASELKASDIDYLDATSLKASAESGSPVYFDNLYFNPDSTNYLSDEAATESFTKAATLYKNASKKEFTFTLKGSQHKIDGVESDTTMATQRAQKAKSQMTALGIPESRITVLEPEITSNDSNYDDIDRKIEIGIQIPSSCASVY